MEDVICIVKEMAFDSTDKIKSAKLASEIATAEGLSGSALEERVKNLTKLYNVEQLQARLNGSGNMIKASDGDEWGHMDVHFSKETQNVPATKSEPQSIEAGSPADYIKPLTYEESKESVIQKFRSDSEKGLELLGAQNDGFIGKTYDSIKEHLQEKLSKSNVAKVLYAQNETANILERADQGDLTVNEYLKLKQNTLFETYPGIAEKTPEEQLQVKQQIEALDVNQLKRLQKTVLSIPLTHDEVFEEMIEGLNNMLEKESTIESTVSSKTDGLTHSETKILPKEPFKFEDGVGEKLMNFESAYSTEQGVRFEQENIEDYNQKSMQLSLVSNASSSLQNIHELLDNNIKLVKGNNQFGSTNAIQENSDKILHNSLLQSLQGLYGEDETALNKGLQNLSGYENIEFKDGNLKYIKNENSPFSMSMNSSTLVNISEKVLTSLDKNNEKLLNGKDTEDYATELAQSHETAFGKEAASLLAHAYKEDQEDVVTKVRTGVEHAGTAVMIGGMIIYPPAALAGGAIASVGGVGVELADEVSKKTISGERLEELTKEFITNGSLMAAGFGAGMAGNAAKSTLLAKNCPKLIAAAADIGTDATLSLAADLALTGQVNLEGEGFSQVMSMVAGHSGKIRAGVNKAKNYVKNQPDIKMNTKQSKAFINEMLDSVDSKGNLIIDMHSGKKIINDYDAQKLPEIKKLQEELKNVCENSTRANQILALALTNPAISKTQDIDFVKNVMDFAKTKGMSKEEVSADMESFFRGLKAENIEGVKVLHNALEQGALSEDLAYDNMQILSISRHINKDNLPAFKSAINMKYDGKPLIDDYNIMSFLSDNYKVLSLDNLSDTQKKVLIAKGNSVSKFIELLSSDKVSPDAKKSLKSYLDKLSDTGMDFNEEMKITREIRDVVNKESTQLNLSSVRNPKIKKRAQKLSSGNKLAEPDLIKIRVLTEDLSKITDPRIKTQIEKEIHSYLDAVEESSFYTYFDEKKCNALRDIDLALQGNKEASGDVAEYVEYLRKEYPDRAERFFALMQETVPEQKNWIQRLKTKVLGQDTTKRVSWRNEALKPIVRDYKMDLKLEPMKKWMADNAKVDPKTADYLYSTKYLSTLAPEIKQACENISKDFGTKVFLGEAANETTAKYIYNELFEWKKAGGDKVTFPPTIDLSQVKQLYIKTKGPAAAYAMSDNKALYFNGAGEDLSNIKWVTRHEMTHANDKLIEISEGIIKSDEHPDFDIGDIISHKTKIDENGNRVKELDNDDYFIPDYTKCKYRDELLAAGISEGHVDYAYQNKEEFIAVASEGDMSKYSPEMKADLIKMGMPEWMFKMKSKNSVNTADEIYTHDTYSKKYSLDENIRLSRSADALYNEAVSGYKEVVDGYKEIFDLKGIGGTSSRVKSLDKIYEKHYRQLEKYDKQIKDAYKTENPSPENIANGIRPATKEEIANEVKRLSDLKAKELEKTELVREKIQDSVGMRIVLDDTSEEAVNKVFKDLLKGIDSGEIKLLSFSNYCGKGLQPYFSSAQVKQLRQHCLKKGYEPEFDSPVNVEKSSPNYKETYHPKKAEKESGYTTTQMNIQHKNGLVSELQIRGKHINELAEVEHIVYDIREGKDLSKGDPKIKSLISDIERLVKEMDKPENAEMKKNFSDYLTKCYEFARKSETGESVQRPELPPGIDMQLDIQNITKIHDILSPPKTST